MCPALKDGGWLLDDRTANPYGPKSEEEVEERIKHIKDPSERAKRREELMGELKEYIEYEKGRLEMLEKHGVLID